MIRSIVALLACALTLGLAMGDAEAKRFGGAKSFGMQRSAPVTAPKAPAAAPNAGATSSTAPKRNSWLGPIAGLAAGLGLAALLSHLGLSEELGSLLLIALLAFAALAVFRRLARAPQAQPRHGMQYAGPAPAPDAARPMPLGGSAGAPAADPDLADFDTAGFVRQAKINFIRMQAAYDAGNLDDIRAFTTPDVFAEVKMQLDERADASQQTDVVDLTGDIVEVVREGERYIVSVRFHGLIREERGAEPQPFDEIWHLTKPVSGNGGWLVSGIQQTH